MKKFLLVSLIVILQLSWLNAQSNLQTYTPSKLLNQGQWDVKWFNNLYSETQGIDDQQKISTFDRQNFFTSSLDIFTGISAEQRLNVGLLLEIRSNTIGGASLSSPLGFRNSAEARSGISSIAPAIKFNPIATLQNFSIQSALSIPLFKNEIEHEVFLDQKGFTWQNRLFFDTTSSNEKFQFFSELNLEYNFGKEAESYANDSLRVSPGLFVSYFPSQNFTLLVLAQHSNLFDISNNFSQNYTALGGGTKYQLTPSLNIELLYTSFVRGNSTGLGKTYNIGLRYLSN